MPRLNTLDGRAVQGKTSVSVAGVVPAALSGITGGNPHWLNEADSEVIYQNVTGSPSFLQSIDLDTSALTTQSAVGQNEMSAGNNVWIAFVAAGANVGTRSNVSGFGPFSLAGPADVDEDGLSAMVQNYQLGRGVRAFDATGALVATWDVPLSAGYVLRCRSGVVAFPTTGFVWQLYSLTTGLPISLAPRVESINMMVPLVSSMGNLVLERSDRLTIRRATDAQGYVITDADTFTPDLIELSPGVIRVAWSATAGEGPTELRMADITLGSGAQTTWTSASGSLVSSTGPVLAPSVLPATGASGSGRELLAMLRHPFVDPVEHVLTPEWQKTLARRFYLDSQAIVLGAQTSGVLPPSQGGTGGTTGTSVINGANIIGIIPPEPLANVPNVGYWTPLTAGTSLTLEQIVAQAGSWSPLTNGNGAAPAIIFDINGDVVPVWTASGTETVIPPFIDDSSGGSIAVWEPTPDEEPFV